MPKRYKEIPSNFNEIQDYLVHEKDTMVSMYFQGNAYFFYDTCSLIHHSNALNHGEIIKYLKNHGATIIVTRIVLMELTGDSFQLHPNQIAFFRAMHENGLIVVLLDEECIASCLKEALSISNEEANLLLGYAIKEVSRHKTAIYQVIQTFEPTLRGNLLGSTPGNELLYDSFFQHARSQKTQGDRLAEEMILICIIILTKIPIGTYVFISDDLRIRQKVIATNTYLEKHHSVREPFQLTTCALVYRMCKESMLSTKQEILDILNAAFSDNVYVYYLTDRDIELRYDSFKTEELAEHMMYTADFNVIY